MVKIVLLNAFLLMGQFWLTACTVSSHSTSDHISEYDLPFSPLIWGNILAIMAFIIKYLLFNIIDNILNYYLRGCLTSICCPVLQVCGMENCQSAEHV